MGKEKILSHAPKAWKMQHMAVVSIQGDQKHHFSYIKVYQKPTSMYSTVYILYNNILLLLNIDQMKLLIEEEKRNSCILYFLKAKIAAVQNYISFSIIKLELCTTQEKGKIGNWNAVILGKV